MKTPMAKRGSVLARLVYKHYVHLDDMPDPPDPDWMHLRAHIRRLKERGMTVTAGFLKDVMRRLQRETRKEKP